MAILGKWKNKKDTRNSVQAPVSKASLDQLPNSPLSQLSSTSSMNSAPPPQQSPPSVQQQQQQQQQQGASFNSNSANRQSQLQSTGLHQQNLPPNALPPPAGAGIPQKQSASTMSPRPVSQIPNFQGPPGPNAMRSVSGGSIPQQGGGGGGGYPTGLSSPPVAGGPTMGGQIPQPQQLQQYNGPGPNGMKSPPTQSPAMLQQQQRRMQPGQQNPNIPQYPWSQKSVSNASPFPRYGHAANYVAARDGEVFVMGGLKGSNVFGDLWVIETGTFVSFLFLDSHLTIFRYSYRLSA